MKNILIVDDEKAFTMSVKDGLKPFSDKLQVFTAENGKEALNIMESNEIHLVVTDLNMPEMNGLQLLAHMSRKHPKIPAIVMTAFGTPELENRVRKLGSNQFLEKPLDIDLLRKKIFEELKRLARGYLSGIGLTSFLQMVELEKKSLTLNIKSGRGSGTLHIKRGKLVDAQCGDQTGLEAALEIVSWRNAEIEINNGCSEPDQPIAAQLTHVILESMRRQEEAAHAENGKKAETKRQKEGVESKVAATVAHSKPKDTKPQASPSQAAPNAEAKTEDKPKTEPERRKQMAKQRTSTDALGELVETQGIMTVAIIGRDGYPIEVAGETSKIDVDGLGGTISVMVDAAETTGVDLEIQPFEQVTLEYKGAVIAVVPCGDAVMAVVSPDNKTLGMVRFKMKKFLPELAQYF